MVLAMLGHTPNMTGTFRKRFWNNSEKTPATLSELFPKFPLRVRLRTPKPPRIQGTLNPQSISRIRSPLSTTGDGLSELVMELPALLRVFQSCANREMSFAPFLKECEYSMRSKEEKSCMQMRCRFCWVHFSFRNWGNIDKETLAVGVL